MAYYEWTGASELGHAEIDQQHKRLLLLGNAVLEPPFNSAELEPRAAQLQALQLQAVIDFAQEHFAFEEGLMRSTSYPYPVAERHAKHHAGLLKELRMYSKGQPGQNTIRRGVMSFFSTWFNIHVDSEDRELVVWLRSHKPDGGG